MFSSNQTDNLNPTDEQSTEAKTSDGFSKKQQPKAKPKVIVKRTKRTPKPISRQSLYSFHDPISTTDFLLCFAVYQIGNATNKPQQQPVVLKEKCHERCATVRVYLHHVVRTSNMNLLKDINGIVSKWSRRWRDCFELINLMMLRYCEQDRAQQINDLLIDESFYYKILIGNLDGIELSDNTVKKELEKAKDSFDFGTNEFDSSIANYLKTTMRVAVMNLLNSNLFRSIRQYFGSSKSIQRRWIKSMIFRVRNFERPGWIDGDPWSNGPAEDREEVNRLITQVRSLLNVTDEEVMDWKWMEDQSNNWKKLNLLFKLKQMMTVDQQLSIVPKASNGRLFIPVTTQLLHLLANEHDRSEFRSDNQQIWFRMLRLNRVFKGTKKFLFYATTDGISLHLSYTKAKPGWKRTKFQSETQQQQSVPIESNFPLIY